MSMVFAQILVDSQFISIDFCHSEDFSLLVAFLLVTFSWLFRGPLLSRKTVFGPFSLLFRGFFVAFSWLFRVGQILRVLALEQSSESFAITFSQLLSVSISFSQF